MEATSIAEKPACAGMPTLRTEDSSPVAGFHAPGTNRLLPEAFAADASSNSEDREEIRDVGAWPDARLVASVCCDPPDEAALDELVHRYWKSLFARCQLLTLNPHKAADLAQEAWCRVLRARRSLKPEGNFPAYLKTIATNLWRDRCRSAERAGPLAEHRLESLDATPLSEDGEAVALVERITDADSLTPSDQAQLAMDIDDALEQLTPRLREVLVARYLDGESCAEIGRRHGRTEQCISGWIRQAIQELKTHFESVRVGAAASS